MRRIDAAEMVRISGNTVAEVEEKRKILARRCERLVEHCRKVGGHDAVGELGPIKDRIAEIDGKAFLTVQQELEVDDAKIVVEDFMGKRADELGVT